MACARGAQYSVAGILPSTRRTNTRWQRLEALSTTASSSRESAAGNRVKVTGLESPLSPAHRERATSGQLQVLRALHRYSGDPIKGGIRRRGAVARRSQYRAQSHRGTFSRSHLLALAVRGEGI